MSDFDDKLSAILGDENAMGQIMALAQSLSGPKSVEETTETADSGETALPELSARRGRDAQLLAALRPYLKDSRQKKLDRALELLQLLRLLKGHRE